MFSLANLHVKSNVPFRINFNGGNLSSDTGLLLLHTFVGKLGLNQLFKNCFKTTDKANSQHLDYEILLQKVYHFCAGYFTDDVSDELSTNASQLIQRVVMAQNITRGREYPLVLHSDNGNPI